MKKRILAWALLLCMLATQLPVSAFAEGTIAEEPTDPVILSESEESPDDPVGDGVLDIPAEDPADPAGADAPDGPEAAEEPADPVILRSDSDEESQPVAEPEEEILRPAQDDTEEAPADVDYISLTEEEFAAQSIPAADGTQSIVDSGECGDNLTWELDDEGTLTISGTGAMWDWDHDDFPWYDCKDSIKSLAIGSGVTSIGAWSFLSCHGLTNVTIPNNVTSIGFAAFYYCNNLKSITLPENMTSIKGIFWGCGSLESVVIPDGVTSIGNYSFLECSSLTSITIPNSVMSIDAGAFSGCSNLCDVYFEGTELQKNIHMRRGWETEGNENLFNAVWHCYIESGTCGDNLTWALDDAGTLTISGTGSMTSYAYYSDVPWYSMRSSIKRIVIHSGVTAISFYAFYDCSSLTSVTIPGSVTDFLVDVESECVFRGCSELKSAGPIGGGYNIEFGWTESIPDYAFFRCRDLKSITIPTGVTNIGLNAFAYCSSLTSVTIPEGVTNIGSSTFLGCSSLTDIMLPGRVTSVGSYAFCACTSLTSIKIPAGVTSIGNSAFSQCSELTKIRFTGPAPSLADNCFYDVSATVYYPLGDSSWTESVRKNYGGNLTWQSYGIGWQQIDGKWYYLNTDGTPKTGWLKSGSAWFYMDAEGVMQTGWVKVGGTWYYMDADGAMQTGWQKIGNTWYYFESGGAMVTGWQKISSKWYYFNASGAMQTGWVKVGSTWYHFASGGAMDTGWLKSGSKWFYLETSGAMVTGWKQISGKWYHFAAGGAMDTGWLKSGSSWYYFESSGAMVANTSRKIGSKTYYFNASGACMNP